MNRNLQTFIALGFAVLTAAPALADGRISDHLKQAIRDRVRRGRIIGIVVGVIEADGREYFAAGRVADDGSGEPDENEQILDREPVHRSAKVARRQAGNSSQITLFFLPRYSPDLNPAEFLNQDVKSNALGRRRLVNRTETTANLRSSLRSTQRQHRIVGNYFPAEPLSHSAGWRSSTFIVPGNRCGETR